MSFSTLFFVFAFLPVCLILYYITPKKLKNTVLLLFSLLFFAWGSVEYLLLMFCAVVYHYFTGRQLASLCADGRTAWARLVLIVSVVLDLFLLGFFKYCGFLVENWNAIFATSVAVRELTAPLGLSFVTFSLLSYLFDVFRGKTDAAKNFIGFSLYVFFFPKLISGPIVPYHEMEKELRERNHTRQKLGDGARLFLIGLSKKLLLADTLGATYTALSGQATLSAAGAWLGALCYALMLYFDFSGYSDMAVGLASLCGFTVKRNFRYPYCAVSLTDFWRRWHISLGAWFRDYVYIPLGGSRRGTMRTIFNLLVVWLLTGLWHGANWTFVLWGVYYGVLLVLEKFVFRRISEKIPKFFRRLVTFVLVLFGWVLFFSPDLSGAFAWLGAMFGVGGKWVDQTALYYLRGIVCLLPIALFAATPLAARLGDRMLDRGVGAQVASLLYFGILLLLCIATMMNATYSTFQYFRF